VGNGPQGDTFWLVAAAAAIALIVITFVG